MFVTCIVVTILAAAANIFSATLDFIRYEPILINMAKVGVSESWITTLGILKAAGALGLLIGIGVPAVGIAAAAGLVLFFIAPSSLTCADTTTRSACDRVPSPGNCRARSGFKLKKLRISTRYSSGDRGLFIPKLCKASLVLLRP